MDHERRQRRIVGGGGGRDARAMDLRGRRRGGRSRRQRRTEEGVAGWAGRRVRWLLRVTRGFPFI